MLEDVEEEEVLLLVVVVVDDPAGVVLGVDVDPDCCCCISKEGKHWSSVTHMWIAFERYMYMSSTPLSLKLTFA